MTSLSMGSVNIVVIVESARDFITHTGHALKQFHVASVVAVAAALGRLAAPLTLAALIDPKASSFFYSFTATRYGQSQVRLRFSGRTTATTCL
jgi:hypothetical protein